MYEIKIDEKMIPSGLELPSNATAIPLKPFAAITLIGSYVTLLPAIAVGARIANAPPRPANAPDRNTRVIPEMTDSKEHLEIHC